MNLKMLIKQLSDNGYNSYKTFVIDTQILFIELFSSSQRKPFILHVPQVSCSNPDYMLEISELNYKTFRQREYLNKIQLDGVACFSPENLSIKIGGVISCYNIVNDPSPDIEDLSEELDSDSFSDIDVDDYPIKDIIPVFSLDALEDDFESIVLHAYHAITEAEEEMNEIQVKKLLSTFDEQKEKLKRFIFDLHKNAYNTRRDIEKAGDNLARVYLLKEKSVNEPDRVRFKIERLALETEEDIDKLNKKLREQRSTATDLLQKYQNYIERFDYLH